MFQAAMAAPHRHDQKQVLVHGRRFTEEPDLLFAYQGEVPAQAFHIGAMTAGDGDGMRYATRRKRREGKSPHLHRMIDEFGVIRRRVAAETLGRRVDPRQAGSHSPVPITLPLGTTYRHFVGNVFLSMYLDEHTGTVEKTVGRVQMGGPHRQIPGVNLIAQNQRSRTGSALPSAFIQLLQHQGTPVAASP